MAETETQTPDNFALFLAEIAHEVNRAYSMAHGDFSQTPWAITDDATKESCLAGIEEVMEIPDTSPEELHQYWCDHMLKEGWQYGETKDDEAKTHPCLLPYNSLPKEQRVKDSLFLAVVRGALRALKSISA